MDYSYFEKLKKPEARENDEKAAKEKLAELLSASVENSLRGIGRVPLAFSGGLDSSLLAYLARRYSRPILFCSGFKNSHDAAAARKSAKMLGLDLELVLLDGLDLKTYRDKTIAIIGTDDNLQVELALPLLVLGEEVRRRGYRYLMTGQGADTLFGGFEKYRRSENLEEDIFRAVKNMYASNSKRDLAVGNSCGLEMIFPFLEENLVNYALKISTDLKIKGGVKKYILREAWRGTLSAEILDQNKKALQYGSGVHQALKKIIK